MKVLMLMWESAAIIDRRVLQQAKSLQGAGYAVELIAGFDHLVESHFVFEGIQVHRFAYQNIGKKLLGIKGRISEESLILKIIKTAYRKVMPYLPWSSYDAFILKTAEQFQFDAVHVHDLMILKHAARLSRDRKCPLIYDTHEIFHEQSALDVRIRRRLKKEERRYISAVDLFITVNSAIADYFESMYSRRPLVLLNCAEKKNEGFYEGSRAALRAEARIASDAQVVLFHGWISAERNLETLVRSVANLPENVYLVVIGYGPYQAELTEVVASLSWRNRIVLLGRMSTERVLWLAGGADVGVMPYLPVDLNQKLCTPNKLYELMAAGVPMVAHDLPVLQTIAEQYGIIAIGDLSTPSGMAVTIASLLSDPQRLKTMKANCRKASSIFNWEVEEQKLLKEYPLSLTANRLKV
jgi:glycosyltransferase involved in cell wall biosynthesis